MKKTILMLAAIFSQIVVSDAQTPTVSIASKKVDGAINVREVKGLIWENATATTVTVMAQNITNPQLPTATIKELRVKSIHNLDKIAFLIEWTDSTRDAIVDADKFCDQIAIQFPLNPDTVPVYTMGNKKGRVHIIHWKAVWQDDCEKGFRDVKDAYPNYWTDIYPLQERNPVVKNVYARDVSAVQVATSDSVARNYMHGTYSGNPMSTIIRKEPVEEAMAEGFGTLTTHEQVQNGSGWGVWENNTWRVILVRPFISEDKNDAPLTRNTKIAFAVWNGDAENVGAKKHFAMWSDLIIEK